jgi:hypothetical protein
MPRPFLSARWANLAIISYAVPPAMLTPYLPVSPAGTTLEIDTRDDLGPGGLTTGPRVPQAFVSLVAFEFQQCRVLGVPWPGHTHFAEINLRFYVRTAAGSPMRTAASPAPARVPASRGVPPSAGGGQRGVVFIREFVPRPLITWAARKFYNEPYITAPITSRITQDTRSLTAEYALSFPLPTAANRDGRGSRATSALDAPQQTLRITGRKPVTRPGPGTVEHWFKEHSWGFGMKSGRTPATPPRPLVYEVIHPTWGIYPVESYDLKFDFAAVYGSDWGFLSGSKPASVLFAAGSEVAVFPGREAVGVRWGMRR